MQVSFRFGVLAHGQFTHCLTGQHLGRGSIRFQEFLEDVEGVLILGWSSL